jgi:5-hydroxyisourate hydrolase
MSGITTHVLDTAQGRPAAGVPVTLESRGDDGAWHALGSGRTDADGRLRELLPADFKLGEGDYRLTFDAGAYFAAAGVEGFYTEVSVAFVVRDAGAHYHVPLLLSPFGYTTYRGS